MKKYMLIFLTLILAIIAAFLFIARNGAEEDAGSVKTELSTAGISSILVDIDTAALTVTVGGTDTAYVETLGNDVSAACHGGELTVRTSSERHTKDAFVAVCLPEGTHPDTCSIKLGVGKLTVNGLSFRTGEISCGIGDSSISFSEIPEKLEIRSGSGDVDASFPGTEEIRIRAPFGLGARNYAERFVLDESADILIDVSLGNTTLH